MKRKKEKSLVNYLKLRIVILSLLTIVLFGLEIFFGASYFTNCQDKITLICFILATIVTILLATYLIYCSISITRIIYKDIYLKSLSNYDEIAHFKYDFKKYNLTKIREFKVLNEKLDHIEESYKGVLICEPSKTYDDFEFDYIKDFENLKVIQFVDFKKNIQKLINLSRTYRNVFVSFKFIKKSDVEVKNEDLIRFIELLEETFKNNSPLISFDSSNQSFYMYLPNIDSISILKDKLNYAVTNFFIADYKMKTEVTHLKASAVIYPYTAGEDILSHLKYAERKGNDVNIYIPEFNSVNSDNNNLYSEKVAKLNKVFDLISSKKMIKPNSQNYIEKITNGIKNVTDLLGFDIGGIATKNFDDETIILRKTYANDPSKNDYLKTDIFNSDFVNTLRNKCDDDSTYVFYDAVDTPHELKETFDLYGIKSGYLYLFYNEGALVGIIFFFNFEKPCVIDNYSRGAILYCCSMIGNILNDYGNMVNVNHYRKNLENVLSLSNIKEYTVNKNNYRLYAVSNELQAYKKNIKQGDLCYEAIYGLKKPCENCPLNKLKRKIVTIDDINYAYHTSNIKESKNFMSVYLLPVAETSTIMCKQRIDPILLLNTTYSLVEELNNKFAMKSKGYLLLARIENKDEILEKVGEDGFRDILINISDNIKENNFGESRVYLYSDDTLGLILNEIGRNEIFKIGEKISSFIDAATLNINNLKINSTQFFYQYPLTYPTAYDFFRNVELSINNEPRRIDNLLILKDENITRPMNKEAYILDLLNTSFNKHSFDIRILPIIKKETKSLYGGEVLLRLKDTLTGDFFSAYEFIDVAIKNDKMHLFTNLIIEQIGKLYKQYGQTVFRSNCLDRISINLDSSYFNSYTFVDDIAELLKVYNFNKDFLSFELNEEDIYNHYELIKGVTKKLKGYYIKFVCDQYTGKFLSFEKLSKIGFEEIKLSRDIVNDIDSNALKLNEANILINEAHNFNMKVTIVGVERKEQLEVIKDNPDVDYLQGYYFYKPLEENDFLSLVKTMLLKIPLN